MAPRTFCLNMPEVEIRQLLSQPLNPLKKIIVLSFVIGIFWIKTFADYLKTQINKVFINYFFYCNVSRTKLFQMQ